MGLAVGGFAYWSEQAWDMANKSLQVLQVVVGIALGAGVYGLLALVLKMEEIEMVLKVLHKKRRRNAR